jgi:hypothetical protein
VQGVFQKLKKIMTFSLLRWMHCRMPLSGMRNRVDVKECHIQSTAFFIVTAVKPSKLTDALQFAVHVYVLYV